MFPSPYGECGLKLGRLVAVLLQDFCQFPSPYGECGLKYVETYGYPNSTRW